MENFCTPIKTPRKLAKDLVTIPASPFLQSLGYGTGVQVFKFNRSPKVDSLKSPWAVKMIRGKVQDKLYKERLRVEASLLRKMNNPYIVGFRQFTKNIDGKECLAMEECTSSLGDLIEQRLDEVNEAFPHGQILKVGFDISLALNYLHTQIHILHGDIKSHNVLIKDNFNICKLCDFGVSLPLKENGELDSEKTGEIEEYEGTLCWCAPEVLKCPPKITDKADIFSYGLVLWEMMALNIPHNEYENKENVDENSVIVLDDSDCTESLEEKYGTRPAVPFNMFGNNPDVYNHPLEIFYCCTTEDPEERPSANILTLSITDMIENKY